MKSVSLSKGKIMKFPKTALFLSGVCGLFGCNKTKTESSVASDGFVAERASPGIGNNGVLTESIGIETLGGVFTPLIPAGTGAPASVAEIFSTAADDQDQIMVHLSRGTGKFTRELTRIGDFRVVGIPLGPRGTPKVQVTVAVQGKDVMLAAVDTVTKRRLMAAKVDRRAEDRRP